jgi:hypothetical protein
MKSIGAMSSELRNPVIVCLVAGELQLGIVALVDGIPCWRVGVEHLCIHGVVNLLAHPVGGVRAATEQVLLAKGIARRTPVSLRHEISDRYESSAVDGPSQPTFVDKPGSTIAQTPWKSRGPQI